MGKSVIPIGAGAPPWRQETIGVLNRVDPGTKLVYTRRGLHEEFRATLVMVLADAIIVCRPSSENHVLVRLDAIDTLELIHEAD